MNCLCGGTFVHENGHFFTFGAFGLVKLTDDYTVTHCVSCGEALVNCDDFEIDEKLFASIKDNVKDMLALIKEKYNVPARYVADFIGVNSKIMVDYINGTSEISPSQFLLLKMLLNHGQKKWKKKGKKNGNVTTRNYGLSFLSAKRNRELVWSVSKASCYQLS